MTGRDLVIYILENHLEDKPVISETGELIGFLTITQAAKELNVGTESIKTLFLLGGLEGIKIGDTILLYPKSVYDRKEFNAKRNELFSTMVTIKKGL